MRAVLCHSFDGIKALSIGEAAEPGHGEDEVLIEVHAASVSYMDYLMICGGYQLRPPLPYVPGTDAAGIVVAVGRNVERFRPGDRVACEGWFGGFAERMIAKALRTTHLPDNVDFVSGSTILHVYLTAWYALVERAQVQAGETVLITGPRAALAWPVLNSRICLVRVSSQRLGRPQRPRSHATMVPKTSSTIPARMCASGSTRLPAAKDSMSV